MVIELDAGKTSFGNALAVCHAHGYDRLGIDQMKDERVIERYRIESLKEASAGTP